VLLNFNFFGVHKKYKWLKTTGLVSYLPKQARLAIILLFWVRIIEEWNKLPRKITKANDFNNNYFRSKLRRLFYIS